MVSKKRIFEFNFIRAVSTIMIVVFHFYIQEKAIYLWPSNANFSMGELGVALFFILSGATLMHSYRYSFDSKEYFKKRFFSIYPMFWIAYFIVFLYNFYMNHGIDNSIPINRLFLSFIGVDGYVMYKIKTFYLLGEWFLGAIIIFYILFPMLINMTKKSTVITVLCVLIIYFYFCFNYKFEMLPDRNILINLPLFLFGMLFTKYILQEKTNKCFDIVLFIIAVLIFHLYFFFSVRLNIPHQVLFPGVSMFIILWFLGKFINNIYITNVINCISNYSYAIFLVHHQIEYNLASYFSGDKLNKFTFLLIFIIYIIKIIIYAKLLTLFKIYILKKIKCFGKIEQLHGD